LTVQCNAQNWRVALPRSLVRCTVCSVRGFSQQRAGNVHHTTQRQLVCSVDGTWHATYGMIRARSAVMRCCHSTLRGLQRRCRRVRQRRTVRPVCNSEPRRLARLWALHSRRAHSRGLVRIRRRTCAAAVCVGRRCLGQCVPAFLPAVLASSVSTDGAVPPVCGYDSDGQVASAIGASGHSSMLCGRWTMTIAAWSGP
jgi:hypothetical protein